MISASRPGTKSYHCRHREPGAGEQLRISPFLKFFCKLLTLSNICKLQQTNSSLRATKCQRFMSLQEMLCFGPLIDCLRNSKLISSSCTDQVPYSKLAVYRVASSYQIKI